MVEESAIDRMAHRNNAPLTLKGVLELDRAVQVALAFASRVPDTLIVVTADHECGGLAVAGSKISPIPTNRGWITGHDARGRGWSVPGGRRGLRLCRWLGDNRSHSGTGADHVNWAWWRAPDRVN